MNTRGRRARGARRGHDGWRPGPVQRTALAGGVVGSLFGLAFGLLALNRPLLNALTFYLLGFAVGCLLGALVGLTGRTVGGGGPRR